MAWSCLASVCLVRVKAVPATRTTAVIRANVDTTPHRDGYRGRGAARDRAADGTAEADAAGEAPGAGWRGRLACPRAWGQAAPAPGKPHPRHIMPVPGLPGLALLSPRRRNGPHWCGQIGRASW